MIPKTADAYFDWYRAQIAGKLLSLDEALKSLREAWLQYPDRRVRIGEMAKIVTLAMAKKPEPVKTEIDELEKNVQEVLL